MWDMDGTLVDSSVIVPDAFIATIRDATGQIRTRDEVIATYSLGRPQAMLDELLGRPSTEEDMNAYYARLRKGAQTMRAYPGVAATLADLAPNLPMAVFTGTTRHAAELVLGAVSLLPHFSVIVGGDEVDNPKPAPDGVLLACGRLGVEPKAAAYVGDAPGDLEAARRSGAVAVAAAWGHLYSSDVRADIVLAEPGCLLNFVDYRPPTGHRR